MVFGNILLDPSISEAEGLVNNRFPHDFTICDVQSSSNRSFRLAHQKSPKSAETQLCDTQARNFLFLAPIRSISCLAQL